MHTTFKELHDWNACKPSYKKLGKALGGIRNYGRNTPIKLSQILDICGLDDTFWVLMRLKLINECMQDLQLFACDCAERALPIFEASFPDDKRPRDAINTARRYIAGGAPESEFRVAEAAAWAAARAVSWAARTAADAAAEAASWAARAARTDGTAADAADAARTATWAAGDACAAEYAAQTEMLNKILRKWERTPPTEER